MPTNLNPSDKGHSNFVSYLSIGLIVLWCATFPAKGAFFQLSLYLIPVLALSLPGHRESFTRFVKPIFIPLGMLVALPLFVSAFVAYVVRDVPVDKEVFDVFWRLVLFPTALVVLCLKSNISALRLQLIFISTALVYALAGLIDMFYGMSFDGRDWGMRAAGLIGNPNPFGFLMASASVVALNLLFVIGHQRYTYWVAIAFMLFFIAWVFSGSRAAGLALGLGLLMVLFFHRDKLAVIISAQKWRLFLVIAALLGLFFVAPLGLFEIVDDSLLRSVFDDLRYNIWSYYLVEIQDYLWIGRGVDEINRFPHRGNLYGPHNLYLEIVLKAGVIGLLAFGLCMLIILKQFYSSIRAEGMISTVLLIMLLAYNFFGTSLLGNELSQGVFTLLLAFYMMGSTDKP